MAIHRVERWYPQGGWILADMAPTEAEAQAIIDRKRTNGTDAKFRIRVWKDKGEAHVIPAKQPSRQEEIPWTS